MERKLKVLETGKEIITDSAGKMRSLTLFTSTNGLVSFWKLSTAAHFLCVNNSTFILTEEIIEHPKIFCFNRT